MANRQIKPVHDNLEKYRTYKEYIKRYNTAIKEGFYFEAILIDYAMMEDRLRSMLYHMGALVDRSNTGITGKFKLTAKEAIDRYTGKDESKTIGITSISGKMKVIRCILAMAGEDTSDDYFAAVRELLPAEDIESIFGLFRRITEWCLYRNEIIHCLMNKSVDSVDLQAAEKAENGFALAREIDLWERKIKSKDTLRKSLKLPIEKRKKIERDK